MSTVTAAELPTASALGVDEARALTEQIKVGIETVWDLIIRAYAERAWSALGYASWDEYLDQELGTTRLRLPREDRQEVVASMRDSGMSVRAISSATGIGYGTVRRELGGEPNGSPADAPIHGSPSSVPKATHIPGDVTADTPGMTARVEAILQSRNSTAQEDAPDSDAQAAPPTVTGADGKKYPRDRTTRKSPRSSILKDAAKISREMRRIFTRVEKLLDDDRFGRNRDAILCEFRPHLEAERELLQRLESAAGES